MSFFISQWSQIKAGGLPTQRRKIRAGFRLTEILVLYACNAIWAVPVVILIRMIRPWAHIRMGTLLSSRIGHFVADASIFLARQTLRPAGERTIDCFWFPEPTCNEQWSLMVRRQLFVRWWVRYLAGFNRLIPGGEIHDNPMPVVTGSRIVYGALRQTTARFEFSLQEVEDAKLFLRRRGWREGEKWVCLLVRDSAYLSLHPLHAEGGGNRWDYHNYRDSDIDSYVKAMLTLLEKGYWVIRMGKIAQSPFPLKDERIIDYPFVEDQSDILDIWLSANCYFFVSTATGIDIVPWVYERPIVYVNALPLIAGAFPIEHIWVPKHLRWMATGKNLTLKEHCKHGYSDIKDYDAAGIAIEELSPSEIAEAVMECEQRMTGTWVQKPEDDFRQERYWNELSKLPEFLRNNDYIHPAARVGCGWLRTMGDEFLE